MQTKILLAAMGLLLAFGTGYRIGCSEPMDAETKQEIRSEMAVELYTVVDGCSSDLCLETFSKEMQMDIRAK